MKVFTFLFNFFIISNCFAAFYACKVSSIKDTSIDMISSVKKSILTADSAVIYLLNPQQQDQTGFEGFKITRQETIDKLFFEPLALTFSDSSNFQKPKFFKNCTFLPDVGLKFFNKSNGNTNVVMVNYCDMTKLTHQDSIISFNSAQNRVANLELLKKILAANPK